MESFKSLRTAIAAVGLLTAGGAYAADIGTDAGTIVSNIATVNYQLNGVAQAAVNSNTDNFTVDRRINLTVAEVGNNFNGGLDSASPSLNQVLTFTVQNLSNSTQDFRLGYVQDATGTAGPAAPHAANGALDSFDTTNVRFFLDDGDGIYDAGDTLITFLDQVPEDETRTVHVVSDVPAGRAPGDISSGSLIAYAALGNTVGALGADEVQTAGADSQNAIDVVFADAAGDIDGARDGAHSDDDAYRIAALIVAKSSRVISDPFNLTVNPKRIPGAVVEYCIAVTNGFSTDITNTVVADDITGDPVTFVIGSLMTGSTDCGLNNGATEDEDAMGADETDPDGASFAGTTATGSFPTIPAGEVRRFQFRVTIN